MLNNVTKRVNILPVTLVSPVHWHHTLVFTATPSGGVLPFIIVDSLTQHAIQVIDFIVPKILSDFEEILLRNVNLVINTDKIIKY